jgi:hypothetical protein
MHIFANTSGDFILAYRLFGDDLIRYAFDQGGYIAAIILGAFLQIFVGTIFGVMFAIGGSFAACFRPQGGKPQFPQS